MSRIQNSGNNFQHSSINNGTANAQHSRCIARTRTVAPEPQPPVQKISPLVCAGTSSPNYTSNAKKESIFEKLKKRKREKRKQSRSAKNCSPPTTKKLHHLFGSTYYILYVIYYRLQISYYILYIKKNLTPSDRDTYNKMCGLSRPRVRYTTKY